ncbi:hypothetical protein DWW18_08545 [Butyricimonas virosa]|uniref:Acyltransferase n=1 Tax=Butyricimonas virosa TaxID=544645 RepID=A0A412X249_9BACT|nr:DapH/DapD/GlmU-related protein [Butyricimonas virosa]RGV34353.1 hypothetical protein DWW18_08545 [Butyricimonas virosa]
MKKRLCALIIFLSPSFVAVFFLKLLGYRMGKGCRIGFSWICVSKIELADNARIGHGNFISTTELHMGLGAFIKKFNVIKGNICLKLGQESVINQFNYITNATKGKKTCCRLDDFGIIGVAHTIDLTSDFFLGRYAILAGKGTQVWTHGFYHSKNNYGQRWRVDGRVIIGENVYVGSRSIICAGVNICSNCTIGAGVIVSKDLKEEGLYVNQALRHIQFEPDDAIKKLNKTDEYIYEK